MQADAPCLDAFPDAPANPAPASIPPVLASPAPERPAPPASFTANLLGDPAAKASPRDDARRLGVGLALAAVYGLAIGTRDGGAAFLHHAAAVPLAPLAVAGLGVPALFIVLTLFDAPVNPARTLAAAARGAATTGLVLAGLAPAMSLFVTTTSSRVGAALCAGVGLIVGGALGLRAFLRGIDAQLREGSDGARVLGGFALLVFALFSIALSARVWWTSLPIFGGAL